MQHDDQQPDVPYVLQDETTGKYIALLKCNGFPVAFMLTSEPPFVMHYSNKATAEEAIKRINAGMTDPAETGLCKYKLLAESPKLTLEACESPFIADDEHPLG